MVEKAVKIAVLFAGQGAQAPGMGKSLYDNSPAAAKIFEAAGDDLKRMIFDGTAEELKDTRVTQPAVFTVDMAAWAAFSERAGRAGRAAACDIVGMAGFSLGEYAAMTASGAIPTFEAGLELVRKRCVLMDAAGRYEDGSPRGTMAAVVGPRDEIIKTVAEAKNGDYVLEAVNFNSPAQTAIAGDAAGIDAFKEAVATSGNRLKVIPLAVSTAFHSRIMAPASDGIRQAASEIDFGIPKYRLCLNLTGDFYAPGATADTFPEIMAKQVMSPVYWQESLEALAGAGAQVFVELGPGRTLTGLARKTVPGAVAVNVDDAESLEEAIRAIES